MTAIFQTRLYKWLMLARRDLIFAILFALIGGVVQLVPYYLLWVGIDALLAGDSVAQTLATAAMGIAAMVVIKFFCNGFAAYLSHKAAFSILFEVRAKLVDRLQVMPSERLARYSTAEIKKILMNDVARVEDFVAHNTIDMVSAIAGPVSAGAFLFWLDWRLALCALVPIPLAICCQMFFYRDMDKRMTEYLDSIGQLNTALLEYVQGIKVMKIYGRDDRSFAHLDQTIQRYHELIKGYIDLTVPSWSTFVVLLNSGTYFILPLGVWLLWNDAISASTLLLVMLVGGNMLKPLLKLTMFASLFRELQYSVDRLEPFFDDGKPQDEIEPDVSPVIPIKRGTMMTGVSLTRNDKTILATVSVHWERPGLYGVVGQSGSGKSHLAYILAGLIRQDAGYVYYNGVESRNLSATHRAKRVTLVTQNPVVFDGDLRLNLTLGDSTLTTQHIEDCLRIVQLDRLVAKLPDGLATPVGEGGATLSGGELQRLALARALLVGTPVIILDEALSSADAITEYRTYQAIAQSFPHTTVISITHRSHVIKDAVRIDLLAGGELAASGSHEQLLQDSELYRELWDCQTQSQMWQLKNAPVASMQAEVDR